MSVALPGGIHVVPSGAGTKTAAEHVGHLLERLKVEVRAVLSARHTHLMVFDPLSEAGVTYIADDGRAFVVLRNDATDAQVLHEVAHVFKGHRAVDPDELARAQIEADALAAKWEAGA
jgi:hypothetical protein